MAPVIAGRNGSRWRRARAAVFATETTCWLCGQPVDQTLPPTHAMGRTVDHVLSLDRGGHPYDRANLRLAHRRCNARKGSGAALQHTSTRWRR